MKLLLLVAGRREDTAAAGSGRQRTTAVGRDGVKLLLLQMRTQSESTGSEPPMMAMLSTSTGSYVVGETTAAGRGTTRTKTLLLLDRDGKVPLLLDGTV